MAEMELKTYTSVGKFEVTNYEELRVIIEETLFQFANVIVVDSVSDFEKLSKIIGEYSTEVELQILLQGEGYLEDVSLKEQTIKMVSDFVGYTVVLDTIPTIMTLDDCKNRKALLNNAIKAFNDERLRIERQYMEPFNIGKNQVALLIEMIQDTSEKLNRIVKEYDEKYSNDKREKIKQIFSKLNAPKFLTLEKVFNPKWINKGTKLAKVEEELNVIINKINEDLLTLKHLGDGNSAKLAVMYREYENSLNISQAILKGDEFTIDKKTIDVAKKEGIENTDKQEGEQAFRLRFEIEATENQIRELSHFLKSNGYKYKKI